MKRQKYSFYPAHLVSDVNKVCYDFDTTVERNIRFMGKTTSAIRDVAPILTDDELSWLSKLTYRPGYGVSVPDNFNLYHLHYWLAINTCCDENGRLCPDGTPTNLVGVHSVSVKNGEILNVTINE